MEEIHAAEAPPALTNQAASASCANELTRSSSEASSLTTEDSKDILQHKLNASPCKCMALTNEKHDHYLNRLEASFVKQLNQSIGLLPRCSKQSKNDRNISIEQSANCASEQRINYARAATVGSHDILNSPWLKRFKYASTPCPTGSSDLHKCCKNHQKENVFREKKISSHKVKIHPEDLLINQTCHYGLVRSAAEGSGQNFVGEDCERDSRSRIKRLKTSGAGTSNGGQMPLDSAFQEVEQFINA